VRADVEEKRKEDFVRDTIKILRARLEEMAGGLLNLEALVEVACDYANGRITLDSFGQRVRSIIAKG
jgi:hypothetical protein